MINSNFQVITIIATALNVTKVCQRQLFSVWNFNLSQLQADILPDIMFHLILYRQLVLLMVMERSVMGRMFALDQSSRYVNWRIIKVIVNIMLDMMTAICVKMDDDYGYDEKCANNGWILLLMTPISPVCSLWLFVWNHLLAFLDLWSTHKVFIILINSE